MRLAYLVHDLDDPAVARRLAMLREHLRTAIVIGFHRGTAAPVQVEGWPALSLGRTADGRLARRAASVLRVRARLGRLGAVLGDVDVVIARQLEMLALAVPLRRRFAAGAVLAYECLDVHRLMVSPTPAGRLLRWIEGRLLRETDLVIVSSLSFVSAHLGPVHKARLPALCLIENKVLAAETAAQLPAAPRAEGPPWRIGWFGVLRCRRSLDLLAGLARALPGQIEVELRGRLAYAAIPDFDALVAAAPGLTFHGRYDRRRDLARIYGGVHFSWAIDYYEDGANSAWLLPNRIYEGGQHGAVPIALAAVETGRFLAALGVGVLLGPEAGDDLRRYFTMLTAGDAAAAAARLGRVPRATWVDDGQDGARLAALLRAPGEARANRGVAITNA